jgi:hypothetical protein
MLLSALITLARPEWDTTAAILASVLGRLVLLSDTMLAWNRFVTLLGIPKVIITYHPNIDRLGARHNL